MLLTNEEIADNADIDRFATAMKKKMVDSKAKGRNGWYDTTLCPNGKLPAMLREHVAKGDPIDVGVLSMMCWVRDESTAIGPTSPAPSQTAGASIDESKFNGLMLDWRDAQTGHAAYPYKKVREFVQQAVADALAGQEEQLKLAIHWACEYKQRAEKAEAERDAAQGKIVGYQNLIKTQRDAMDVMRGLADLNRSLAQVAGGQGPVGWKLVPVEPTREMLEAAQALDEGEDDAWAMWASVYAALIGATPQPAPVAGEVDIKPLMELEDIGWEFVEGVDPDWITALPLGTILYYHATPPAISTDKDAAPDLNIGDTVDFAAILKKQVEILSTAPVTYALQSPTGQIVGQVHATRTEAERFAMPGNVVVELDIRK